MNYNERNRHSRDEMLEFDPAGHIYTVHGTVYRTVTAVVEDCFEKFDADYWAERKATPSCPAEELKRRWEENGRRARELGTRLHDNIERYYLGEDADEDVALDVAYRHFCDFARVTPLKPHRTEWGIYAEECRLAGTLDFLADNGDGTFDLWDWKRSNKVVGRDGRPATENTAGKCGFGPLAHIPDTAYYHYALQLSIYRFILERKYGIEVRSSRLGVFHPDNSTHYIVEVPYLRREVIILLNSIK